MEQVLEKYSVSNAKENLSALLSGIEHGGKPFVISRYGKPIAVVSSYSQESKIEPKLRGCMSEYANKDLISQEKDAWKRAVRKK